MAGINRKTELKSELESELANTVRKLHVHDENT